MGRRGRGAFVCGLFLFLFCKSLEERVAVGRRVLGCHGGGAGESRGRGGKPAAGPQEQLLSPLALKSSQDSTQKIVMVLFWDFLSLGRTLLALSVHEWKMKCEASQRHGDREVSCLCPGTHSAGRSTQVTRARARHACPGPPAFTLCGHQLQLVKKTPGRARPQYPNTPKQNQN